MSSTIKHYKSKDKKAQPKPPLNNKIELGNSKSHDRGKKKKPTPPKPQ